MSPNFAATMRRTTRLLHPRQQINVVRNMQKAMADVVINAAFAPFTDQAAKPAKRRKVKGPKVGRSLGVAVKQLRAAQSLVGGAGARPGGRQAKPRIPTGAQYLARKHRSATGSRGYKLYLPASRPRQPKGLILMLHGCSQNPDDFAIGTHMNALAEMHGLAVAYPAQTRSRLNRASCWNWFRPTHQLRGVGEPAVLVSLTRKLMREFGISRDGVFVAGLSAGGAMAVILADLYPDVYSAAGVHSGLARGSAHDVISAMSVMRSGAASTGIVPTVAARARPVRRIIFQGAEDRTVHPSNAAMIVAAVVGGDAVPTRTGNRSAGGRDYARSEYAGSDGATLIEHWMIEGAGHAWSGGRAAGSYADRQGPDASAHMIRFFMGKSA